MCGTQDNLREYRVEIRVDRWWDSNKQYYFKRKNVNEEKWGSG